MATAVGFAGAGGGQHCLQRENGGSALVLLLTDGTKFQEAIVQNGKPVHMRQEVTPAPAARGVEIPKMGTASEDGSLGHRWHPGFASEPTVTVSYLYGT